MGLRYRKQIKVTPGVKLNLSKSGVSTSLGKPGSTVNLSSRGVKTTVGIPGSGISYSKTYSGKKQSRRRPAREIRKMDRELKKRYGMNNHEVSTLKEMIAEDPEGMKKLRSDEAIMAQVSARVKEKRKKTLKWVIIISVLAIAAIIYSSMK